MNSFISMLSIPPALMLFATIYRALYLFTYTSVYQFELLVNIFWPNLPLDKTSILIPEFSSVQLEN